MRLPVSSPFLVGRETEAAELTAAVDGAAAGQPSLTVLAGEAGIGKTRLLRAVARTAQQRGIGVLRGECVPLGEGELPYAPIVAALREALRSPLGEVLRDTPSQLRNDVALLLPELAPDATTLKVPSPFSQARLFEHLLTLVRLLTSRRPLLVVVEDLHWADPATRDLLAFLVRNLRDERLAAIVSYRPDELGRRHPLRRLLGDLMRRDGVTQIELGRLDRTGVERQLEGILGHPPSLTLLGDVFARSEGNPFYTEELLAAQRDGGAGVVPSTIRDTLLARVDTLSAGALELVRIAATAGRPLPDRLLAVAAGVSEREAAGLLREAIAAHILDAESEYTFRHALVREAVYDDLIPGERTALHRVVGHALANDGAEASELAYHWQAAGEAEPALYASVDAGRAAARVYAFAQAVTHFERALSLWDAVAPEDLDRVAVLCEAADAARLTADYDRAVTHCMTALDTDPSARIAELYERLGDAQFADDEAALTSYAAALELLPPEAIVARARVLAAQARTLTHLLRWDEACAASREALELATAAGSESEICRASMTLGIALTFLGEIEAGEVRLLEAKAVAECAGRPDDIARAYVYLAEARRLQGDFAGAFMLMEEGAARSVQLGLDASFGRFMRVNAAEDLLRQGHWDEAESRLSACGREDLKLVAEVMAHAIAAQLAACRGRFAVSREHAQNALAVCERGIAVEYLPGVYTAAAELALWEGRADDARLQIAGAVARIGEQTDPLNLPALYTLGVRAEAELRTPDVSRADAFLRQLERLADGCAVPEAHAQLAWARAERLRLTREPTTAAWSDVAETWDRLGQPYPAAYARWRTAESILAGGGDRRVAAPVLRRAHTTAGALGAAPLVAAIEALARAARLDLAEPVAAPAVVPAGGLSAREHDVLELLAEGLTNRQIAERLFISERTVGVHVSRILAKLDAPNRLVAAGIGRRLGMVRS